MAAGGECAAAADAGDRAANGTSNAAYADRIAAIRQGLREQGFIEGQNVTVEYRSAEGQYDRLPALAADLVRARVAVIVAIGATPSAQAAKAATSTIPIVFAVGSDAINSGLVTRLNRPEANVTGMNLTNSELGPKRLQMLRELLPHATLVGYLVNPNVGVPYQLNVTNFTAAAGVLGFRLAIFNASLATDIEAAFTAMVQQKIAGLMVEGDAFLNSQRDPIVTLSARHAIPTIYANAESVRTGGLMSYAVMFSELYRQAGTYAGRILKGEKPADLPVVQPTKFETILNLKTARALGLTVPTETLLRADEVIE